MAMVKADGYGHGMVESARLFSKAGAAAFGVAEVGEGVRLRKAGLIQPIFVFIGALWSPLTPLLDYYLTPVVVNNNILSDLSSHATQRGRVVDVHIKVDAGMGRQGCSTEELPDLIEEIKTLPGIKLDGITAHFPKADEPCSSNTLEVFNRFTGMVKDVARICPEDCILHIANSGGFIYFPETRLQMVRPGISLYGYYPDGIQGRKAAQGNKLRPAMSFKSRIIQLREVKAGTGLGYGHTYVTKEDKRIALLPVGYANGYLRSMSGKAFVLIRGQMAPVLGRISMNLTLVDASSILGVEEGDEVVILGRQGDKEITADDIASWINTISYEVLCLFGNLNDRYYID